MKETAHELLLPVGSMDMLLAAIHNGADAVYFGFPEFNARGRSADFSLDELRAMIETAHLHGVKTNVALNIVIFQDELEKLVPRIEQVLPLKPDAFIVQDLGLAAILRRMAPDQVIHASTQMSITNHEAIALLDDLNIKRFVLGRENSLGEIELIKAQTQKELEVFVHGALCVSYSGQCFTSESLGGRSANRGQCAQSCRFSYEMLVDGEHKTLVDKNYLVSPRDLCGVAEIPALMDRGVTSFKVEGRLKAPEYVAAAGQEYRAAIDRHRDGRDLTEPELADARDRLSTTYSRGFFTGWLHGVDHQHLVDGQGKSHRGRLIGTVVEASGSRMIAALDGDFSIDSGDALLWSRWTGQLQNDRQESGAQVYRARPLARGRVEIQFGNDVRLDEGLAGAQLFLNHVAAQKRELRRSFNDKSAFKRIPVEVRVEAAIGAPLKVTMSDGRFTCKTQGAALVEPARTAGITDEFVRDELAALGGTVFSLGRFAMARSSEAPLFYPHKDLKEIRRRLTAELEERRRGARVAGYETTIAPSPEIVSWMRDARTASKSTGTGAAGTKLNILLRERAQVTDFLEAWQQGRFDKTGGKSAIDAVILDFEFGMDYEPSIVALKAAGVRCGIATTRILKPKEYTHFTRIERLAPDVILVRNLGALHYFTAVKPFDCELRGDFSLNVTNDVTARYLLGKGLSSVAASYDLNANQVSDLLSAADASRMEITVHQYMPSFHMEHCVFAAFLSKGSSFRDCGKPCEKHKVELKDQFGNRHHIKADPECRNTMYNAVPQSAARFIGAWRSLGLGRVRYEALHERGVELVEKIRGYQDLLTGARSPEQVVAELGIYEKYGLDEGAIARSDEYQSRKKPHEAVRSR